MQNEKRVPGALQSPVDRRGFVRSVGLVTAGIAGAAVSPTTGGNEVDLIHSSDRIEITRQLKAVMEEITYDEQQHVLSLRSALGADAVAKPRINLR